MAFSNRRSIAVILFISLALNLFAAGAIAVHYVRGMSDRHWNRDWEHHPALMQLDEDSREHAVSTWSDGWREVRPHFREMWETRREVMELFAADPVDMPALEAGLADMRARMGDAGDAMSRSILRLAEELSAEERAALAVAINERRHSRDRKRPDSREDEKPKSD